MKKYRTILIDPPWPEKGGGKCKRGADRHYPVLHVRDIPRVIMSAPCFNPAYNSHLYLWVTDNYLREGLWVMEQLCFRYICVLPWIKVVNNAVSSPINKLHEMWQSSSLSSVVDSHIKCGIGQYFRGGSELLLFGVRGKGMDTSVYREKQKDVHDVIIGPRSTHSKKPIEAYWKIELRSKGPYLEMFARENRVGWDSWGNEV